MSKSEASDGELLEHEYDGIREYDNPLPRWWVWAFWASFWFAIVYLLVLHVYQKGETAEQAYRAEMSAFREAEAKRVTGSGPTEENLGKLLGNAALMADAEALYQQRCQVCHADKGQGKIGPNLTDDHWLYGGGSLLGIYKVIKDGAANGMPAWSQQLSPIELQKITAYVGAMRGKNLAGKAPQGQPAQLKPGAAAPGSKPKPGAQGE